jgi:hypothetical protein
MAGLLVGAALAGLIGPRAVFVVFAGIALLAVPVAMRLPDARGQVVRGAPRFGLPARIDVWSFVQGMTLDGLFILGLGVLARDSLPEQASLAAGAALALRYLAEIVLGPPSGALAERFGAARLLILCSCLSAAGLAAIGFGALWAGVVAVVMLRGLIQPLPAPVVAATTQGAERVPALARLATWRDLGAGVGPLIAGALLPVLPIPALYGAAAALLAIAALAMRKPPGS